MFRTVPKPQIFCQVADASLVMFQSIASTKLPKCQFNTLVTNSDNCCCDGPTVISPLSAASISSMLAASAMTLFVCFCFSPCNVQLVTGTPHWPLYILDDLQQMLPKLVGHVLYFWRMCPRLGPYLWPMKHPTGPCNVQPVTGTPH